MEGPETFEVGKEREAHLGSSGADHELRHHEPEVFHRAHTAAVAAIAHEAGCLVLPFAMEEINRVLERAECAVVVLRRNEDKGSGGDDLRAPDLVVRGGVLADYWRHGLV